MFDTRIEILAYSQERDDYNERTHVLSFGLPNVH